MELSSLLLDPFGLLVNTSPACTSVSQRVLLEVSYSGAEQNRRLVESMIYATIVGTDLA